MRAPETEATGTAGASEVAAEFQRLGWGATENARHDLGTDLFLAVRDERRFDLGLIVGAQVKAGPSYFGEPKYDDGELEGWWYRDADGKHIDAWLSHTLPHLVVLRNMEERVSYWAHVTADAVVPTAKGAKLLVPCTQVVSADQREALLEVAKSQRPSVPWEGSIWTAGSALTPHQLLRHALVVPRLVAPHPNAGVASGLTPEQAVAMLMQARLNELDRFAREHRDVPPLRDAGESSDWRWRYARALHERLTTSDLDTLIAAVEDAPSPWTRAAATVAAAAALTELARPEEALELLNATLDRDDAEPVDHAWLLMQRARASAEIGHLEEARADALAVVDVRNAAPHDATATALAGAAANLLFNTSAWGSRELEQAITGSDTAASWWRQQTTARGLRAIVDRTFKAWAAQTTANVSDDEASNQLFAASVLASHLGSQGGWRNLAGLTVCDVLMQLDRYADPEHAGDGLDELRRAGATKELTLAANKLALDGPATAVTRALANVDLDRSTRTTAGADLGLLKTGGHLADEATATRVVKQLLAILDSPGDFFARTTASRGVEYEIVEALAGVIPAADAAGCAAIREHVLALDAIENQLLATDYAKIARALPRSTWDEDAAARATKAADAHHIALEIALLGVAALHDDAASERLIAFARDGSLDAVRALGDVRDLPGDVATALTDRLAESAERVVADAHDGRVAIGGTDIGSWLVVLNAWHPESAKWEPLLPLLADAAVPMEAKRASLRSLASLADHLPPGVRKQLSPVATRIARREVPEARDFFGSPGDAAGEATNLILVLGSLDPEASADRLVDLLGGSSVDRRWAARFAARAEGSERLGVLVTLASDADPSVRAAAAEGLATAVATGVAEPLVKRALEACIADPGVLVPAHVAGALRAAGGEIAETLLAPLRDHRSAYVRNAARGADA